MHVLSLAGVDSASWMRVFCLPHICLWLFRGQPPRSHIVRIASCKKRLTACCTVNVCRYHSLRTTHIVLHANSLSLCPACYDAHQRPTSNRAFPAASWFVSDRCDTACISGRRFSNLRLFAPSHEVITRKVQSLSPVRFQKGPQAAQLTMHRHLNFLFGLRKPTCSGYRWLRGLALG